MESNDELIIENDLKENNGQISNIKNTNVLLTLQNIKENNNNSVSEIDYI